VVSCWCPLVEITEEGGFDAALVSAAVELLHRTRAHQPAFE
jgi:hypothetical protein